MIKQTHIVIHSSKELQERPDTVSMDWDHMMESWDQQLLPQTQIECPVLWGKKTADCTKRFWNYGRYMKTAL